MSSIRWKDIRSFFEHNQVGTGYFVRFNYKDHPKKIAIGYIFIVNGFYGELERLSRLLGKSYEDVHLFIDFSNKVKINYSNKPKFKLVYL